MFGSRMAVRVTLSKRILYFCGSLSMYMIWGFRLMVSEAAALEIIVVSSAVNYRYHPLKNISASGVRRGMCRLKFCLAV